MYAARNALLAARSCVPLGRPRPRFGVFCAAIPEQGLGIALKCEDGSTRGAEAMIGAVLAKLFSEDQELSAKLGDWSKKSLKNWNGIEVGQIRPVGELA